MKAPTIAKRVCQLLVVSMILLPGRWVLADQGDPPARVATVSYLSGKVSLQPAGVSQWSEASLNYPMTNNDRLYTDQGGRAELSVGSAAVRLSEATDLTVANLNDQLMQLGLAQGTIRVSLYELPSGNSVEIDTPNGALLLQQPGNYRVDSFPNDNATLLTVNTGQVQLSGGGLSQTVQAGQAVKLTGTGPIDVAYVSPPAEDSFDQWSAQRDAQFTSSPAARYVSRDMPGYETLDGYGVWSEAPQYGPIWYPNAVPAGWVPYQYGRWAWVSPWGWTWISNEPWGFAPFHYGRWAYVGTRWGWIPGPMVVRPYYAPALVAFVGGAGFSAGIGVGRAGFAAWFPLGPREPYYPWYHCGNTYLRQVNITNVRNVTNITTFVNVRNVHNVRYVNQHIATTVVHANAFSTGAPVRSSIVRVNAAQLSKARPIPHPEINPARSAAFAGRPVTAPPRRVVTARARQRLASIRPVNPSSTSRAPLVQRNAALPPPRERAGLPARAQNGPPTARRQLITRNAPAPHSVSFSTKLNAMQSHPGRALEPRQVSNLRAGKPAGPMGDKEYISHRQQPAPRERAAPAREEQKQPERKRH